jgi:hypothetical protein
VLVPAAVTAATAGSYKLVLLFGEHMLPLLLCHWRCGVTGSIYVLPPWPRLESCRLCCHYTAAGSVLLLLLMMSHQELRLLCPADHFLVAGACLQVMQPWAPSLQLTTSRCS